MQRVVKGDSGGSFTHSSQKQRGGVVRGDRYGERGQQALCSLSVEREPRDVHLSTAGEHGDAQGYVQGYSQGYIQGYLQGYHRG